MKLLNIISFIVASSATTNSQNQETTAKALTGRYTFNDDFKCQGDPETISRCGRTCLKVFSGVVSSKGTVKFGDFPTVPECKCMTHVPLRQQNGIVDIRATSGTNYESDKRTSIWSGYNLACFGNPNGDPFCQASTADGLFCSGTVRITSRPTYLSHPSISSWGHSRKEVIGEYRVVEDSKVCIDHNNNPITEQCAKVADLFTVSLHREYNNLVYSGFRKIEECTGMRGLKSQVNDYSSAKGHLPHGDIIYGHHASNATKSAHIQCQHIKIPDFSYYLTRCISRNADGVKCSGVYTIDGAGDTIDIFGAMSYGIPLHGKRVIKQAVYNAMTNYTTYLDGIVSTINKISHAAHISF